MPGLEASAEIFRISQGSPGLGDPGTHMAPTCEASHVASPCLLGLWIKV